MYFLGIEHGTRGVRGAFLSTESEPGSFELKPAHFFEIARTSEGRKEGRKEFPSILEKIKEFSPLSEIKLVVLTYSMGDAFHEIADIRTLRGRGIQSIKGAGRVVGLGTAVFDELRESGLRVFVLPGIHRDTPTLLPEFRILYSHIAAPDKLGSAYHASLFLKSRGMAGENFILTDGGANTVSLLVKDGKIAGGMDAAVGAPGLLQGLIDLEGIRRIDSQGKSANEVFSEGGLFPCLRAEDIPLHPEFPGRYRALASAISMEVKGLTAFLPAPEAVVVTGSASSLDPATFSGILHERLNGLNLEFLEGESAASGCAEIARDLYHEKREFLGIGVQDGNK